MTRHILFRIFAGLVLLAAIAGIAFFAYSAGRATNAQLPVVQQSNQPNQYYSNGFHFWGPFPFFGLGCFVPLLGLFLICLAFNAMRHMIWGPRWGWHRMYRHGHWGEEGPMGQHGPWSGKDDRSVPPMVAEWHRRMHETPTDKTSEESGK